MIVILVAVVCVAAAFGGCRFIRGQILDGPGMERDTLYNEDAVIAQVNAVYDYWNELRTNFDENKPYVTVDDRFGTKEWRQVRDEVAAIDRDRCAMRWLLSTANVSAADSLISVMKDRSTPGPMTATKVPSGLTVFR